MLKIDFLLSEPYFRWPFFIFKEYDKLVPRRLKILKASIIVK